MNMEHNNFIVTHHLAATLKASPPIKLFFYILKYKAGQCGLIDHQLAITSSAGGGVADGGGGDDNRSYTTLPAKRQAWELLSMVRSCLLNPYWLKFSYLFAVSTLGFILFLVLEKDKRSGKPIGNFDLFFMSVSATTASSMASVNMENFSNSQMVVMTFLMLFGGEIFISMLSLQLGRTTSDQFKSLFKFRPSSCISTSNYEVDDGNFDLEQDVVVDDDHQEKLKVRSSKCLGDVVFSYLIIVNLIGSLIVLAYISMVKSARKVLEDKGLNLTTFSVFTVVSTFANCGFLPTNENMIVLNRHSFLSLFLVSQILMGNTLFPLFLNTILWVLRKLNSKKEEFDYLWKKGCTMNYEHLFKFKTSLLLTTSVVGFITLQFILYCALQWNSESLQGLDTFQRIANGIFQSVNTRHSGETAFDLSAFSPALLAVYIVMMYIPPYAYLSPLSRSTARIEEAGEEQEAAPHVDHMAGDIIDISKSASSTIIKKPKIWKVLESLMPNQVSYLILFVIIACITERDNMRKDPLNFNLLSIAFEVTSTYGNVGLSMGYSCQRLLKISSSYSTQASCEDTWVSLCGNWSREGKILILFIMFYGRLKKLTSKCGKAWVTN